MSELIADCPRCGSRRITFDLTQQNLLYSKHGWQYWYEAFCICRNCKHSTTFVLAQDVNPDHKIVHQNGLLKLGDAVNRYMRIEGHVSLKDAVAAHPPKHLPPEIEAVFREGATCLAVGCYNAAGTMFAYALI